MSEKKTMEFPVKGMSCKSCSSLIEEKLSGHPGVESIKVDLLDETASVTFDPEKTTIENIKREIGELGYKPDGQAFSSNRSSKGKKGIIKQGLVYGLVPHIGCIGFIVATVLGVTVAIELFRPILMNPYFFHILVLISFGFATVASTIYLRSNGFLSWKGLKRKKGYLATMYGVTIGVNLLLFLVIFPALANIDMGEPSLTGAFVAAGGSLDDLSSVTLQVNIPCPGHAPLITGELKTISGVASTRFDFPNIFTVSYEPGTTSVDEMLSLEVFGSYPATVIDESGSSSGLQASAPLPSSGTSTCSGNCGTTIPRSQGGCGCGSTTCGI